MIWLKSIEEEVPDLELDYPTVVDLLEADYPRPFPIRLVDRGGC